MNLSVLNAELFRPSQIEALSTTFSSEFQLNQANFISTSGCDITQGARVNLLYEVPLALLATRFNDDTGRITNKFKIMIHELNGCIVGPGLYQEWTNYIYAARNKHEQNLELCRSVRNNMLYYQATRSIKKGEQLLAWYSQRVEGELSKSLLNRDAIHRSASNNNDTQCKYCQLNFEHVNILKSHLLFEVCGKKASGQSDQFNKKTHDIFQKLTSTTPPSSSSACSTTSSCSSTDSPKPFEIKSEFSKKTSAFSPIFNKQTYKSSASNLTSSFHSFHQNMEPSSVSSNSSLTCSPVGVVEENFNILPSSHSSKFSRKNKEPKRMLNEHHHKVESYLLDHQIPKHSRYDLGQESVSQHTVVKIKKTKHQDQPAEHLSKLPKFAEGYPDKKNGIEWKITMLDGTQTVELNMSDDLGKQKKTHVCLFCGKVYNRKYGLKIHLRTHTGYKPLKCKVCSRPFSDPSNLNKHVRLHSQGDTPYRCPYCGKILVRKRDLDRHIMSRHSGKDMSDMNRIDNDGKYQEETMDSGNTEEEDHSDLEDLEEENEEKMSNEDCSKFFSSNKIEYFRQEQDRSFNASPAEISIQKIIESSQ